MEWWIRWLVYLSTTIGVAFYKRGDIIIQDNGRGLPSGETIDETIKTLRLDKNWEAFQNLYTYSERLESLENNMNAICDGLNVNERFRILKKL